MAEGRSQRGVLQVQLDYAFDRLRAPKLAQAYEILVPGRERRAGAAVKEIDYEDGSDLCTGLLGAAARGAYDCEPDGGADWFPKGHDLDVRQDWVFEAEGMVERYWTHRALARAEPRRRRAVRGFIAFFVVCNPLILKVLVGHRGFEPPTP